MVIISDGGDNHSRYNEAVDATKKILKRDGLKSARIDWRESVRKWHPGQEWVWEPGGFGVCDPGINALSILTAILPFPVYVESATLAFPAEEYGTITVNANPFGTVFIDGAEVGTTPIILYRVKAGRHTIRVERAGYKTQTETVQVDANNPVRRGYTLIPEG